MFLLSNSNHHSKNIPTYTQEPVQPREFSEQVEESNNCYRGSDCSIICENIKRDEPGQVAAAYINKIGYVTGCQPTDPMTLEFHNCLFPNNTLQSGWFNPSFVLNGINVTSIIIIQCYIQDIRPGAFLHFNNLLEMTICENDIRQLKNNTFIGLKLLENLSIRDEMSLEAIEVGTLQPLKGLKQLQMQRVIKNDEMLQNITSIVPLKGVVNVDFRDNSISVIEEDSFNCFPNVQMLYLSRNNLSYIKPGSFQQFPSLVSLYFDSNQLTTLARDVFGSSISVDNLELEGK